MLKFILCHSCLWCMVRLHVDCECACYLSSLIFIIKSHGPFCLGYKLTFPQSWFNFHSIESLRYMLSLFYMFVCDLWDFFISFIFCDAFEITILRNHGILWFLGNLFCLKVLVCWTLEDIYRCSPLSNSHFET